MQSEPDYLLEDSFKTTHYPCDGPVDTGRRCTPSQLTTLWDKIPWRMYCDEAITGFSASPEGLLKFYVMILLVYVFCIYPSVTSSHHTSYNPYNIHLQIKMSPHFDRASLYRDYECIHTKHIPYNRLYKISTYTAVVFTSEELFPTLVRF